MFEIRGRRGGVCDEMAHAKEELASQDVGMR
jgi:hypothetical protein